MEVTIKYTELIMVAIILIQIIALVLVNLNLKILKNGLQEKKKIQEKKLQNTITNTIPEIHKREKIQKRKPQNQVAKKLQTEQRRRAPLRQRDDK